MVVEISNCTSEEFWSEETEPFAKETALSRGYKQVLEEVLNERNRQRFLWGKQDHPNGTGPTGFHKHVAGVATRYKMDCEIATANGSLTFRHILLEEVFEAMAEEDPQALRDELVQVAAVAVQWIEAIDRKEALDVAQEETED